jgi:hypothetical protein
VRGITVFRDDKIVSDPVGKLIRPDRQTVAMPQRGV